MGCCASQPSTMADTSVQESSPQTTGKPFDDTVATPVPVAKPIAPMADSVPTPSGAEAEPAEKVAPDVVPFAAPAPGVKHIRPAYAGKGWAPPQKEWESSEKRKGDKTRIEIEDQWDDDGNLHRTTIKHIITPDWKKKTEKTIEIIPADEAEKMGLGRK